MTTPSRRRSIEDLPEAEQAEERGLINRIKLPSVPVKHFSGSDEKWLGWKTSMIAFFGTSGLLRLRRSSSRRQP
eukprot:scaffold2087_cov153-Pinguiococcus_pyrenoidosus.AAC.1